MLDKQLKSALYTLSRKRNTSMSELVRVLLAEKLEDVQAKEAKKMLTPKEIVERMVKNAGYGPGNSEYDRYAYGDFSKKES